jgi:hypothetical protein
MEYSRELGSIQGDLALRAGLLYVQYRNLVAENNIREDQRYDATLAVCVLQALLTNCTELLDAIRERNKSLFLEPLSAIHSDWLSPDSVQKHDIEPTCTLSCVLVHIRNALSHPTPSRATGRYQVTGYSTVPDGSGRVGTFKFVDSPWVYGRKLGSQYLNRNHEKVQDAVNKFAENSRWPNGTFSVVQGGDGKYSVLRDGQPFFPVCVITLSIDDMQHLILSLANYLAQATKRDWDLLTITPLVVGSVQ